MSLWELVYRMLVNFGVIIFVYSSSLEVFCYDNVLKYDNDQEHDVFY